MLAKECIGRGIFLNRTTFLLHQTKTLLPVKLSALQFYGIQNQKV